MEFVIPKRSEYVLRMLRKFCEEPGVNQWGIPYPPLVMTLLRIPERIDAPTTILWPTHSDMLEMELDPIGNETFVEIRPRGQLFNQDLYESLLACIRALSEDANHGEFRMEQQTESAQSRKVLGLTRKHIAQELDCNIQGSTIKNLERTLTLIREDQDLTGRELAVKLSRSPRQVQRYKSYLRRLGMLPRGGEK